MTAWGRRRAAVGAVSLVALLVTGCGIRTTGVPTDFGPAPSRAPCALSEPGAAAQPVRGIPVQVFLLCSTQLVTVDRTVELPTGQTSEKDRGRVAQALLTQLEQTPSRAERQAGYTTDVRGGLTVSGPRGSDPDDALRISAPVDDLSQFALAQLVCTLANSAAASRDGRVILGGPGDDPLRTYECTPEVRSRPGTHEPPNTVLTPT